MTTITINDSKIRDLYTKDELEKKFLEFLLQDLEKSTINLYEIDEEDLPISTKNALKNYDEIEFVEYNPWK